MDQIVRVKKIYEDGTAQVICIRESACSGDCHKCSGCGAAKEAILLTVENPIGAGVGDLVNIRSETGPVLKAAAVLYMLPLVLFFAGYLMVPFLREELRYLCGGIGFSVGIAAAVFGDRAVRRRNAISYEIIRKM